MNSMLCDVVSQLPKNDCNITVECDDEDYCINADEEWIREAFINIDIIVGRQRGFYHL